MRLRLAALIFVGLALVSCGYGPYGEYKNARFSNGRIMICVDETEGDRWVIQHHIGDTFLVSHVEEGK